MTDVSESADDAGFDPTDKLADLLYTGVGLGVLAINRIQVARRDLQKSMGESDNGLSELGDLQALLADPERLGRVAERIRGELRDLDNRVDGIENRIAAVLDDIEPDLPPTLRDVSRLMRMVASEHADQVRAILGLEGR